MGGDRPGPRGELQSDFYEGPAQPRTEVGPGRRTGFGLGAEFGGAGVVQGEVDVRVHWRTFQSVRIGKAWVWMRTCSVPGACSAAARSR
ncbi:hypothetical protein GCM10010103_18540 [Streptomyces paradoxus]